MRAGLLGGTAKDGEDTKTHKVTTSRWYLSGRHPRSHVACARATVGWDLRMPNI